MEVEAQAQADIGAPSGEDPPAEESGRDDESDDDEYWDDDVLLLPAPPPQLPPPGGDIATRAAAGQIRRSADSDQGTIASDAGPLPAADPSRFYEPEYAPVIAEMGMKLIDAEGPITFKRLSDQIARAHGFQRTGREITAKIWAAVRARRTHTRTPDEHEVFWPDGVDADEMVGFRGMGLGGTRREWREIPYPEKLGLVRSILEKGTSDLARDVADVIGVGRITVRFKDEVESLRQRLGE